MDWLLEHKVLSGIGGTILTISAGIIAYIFRKKGDKSQPSQSITSGENSTNIQGGNDVKVTIGDKK